MNTANLSLSTHCAQRLRARFHDKLRQSCDALRQQQVHIAVHTASKQCWKWCPRVQVSFHDKLKKSHDALKKQAGQLSAEYNRATELIGKSGDDAPSSAELKQRLASVLEQAQGLQVRDASSSLIWCGMLLGASKNVAVVDCKRRRVSWLEQALRPQARCVWKPSC